MNVYFILLGLLSGAVPTDVVVPARTNLLPAHMKHRQSAPLVRPVEDYQMKDASVRRWAQEYISEVNTLERHRMKRADNPKSKSTAGLEKDTDDPDGVYRKLDDLKSMKPGPGVQWRDEMPVMSKENAADLRRKKRSRQITTKRAVTNLNRPYESNIKYWHKLFSQNDDGNKNKMKTNLKYMKLHVKTNRVTENLSTTHYNGFNGGSKHGADRRVVHTKTLLPHLENHAKLSSGRNISDFSAWPKTGVKNNVLKNMWSDENVMRRRNHRIVREAESSDRASDSTDVSADSDLWWNRKLNYIDSRNAAGYRTKLQQANNSDNLESTPEQRRTAISLRGVISEEKPPQSTSKQFLQSEISTNTDSKGDDWLKNELMLIEIESRALKRKAAQLHNKLRKANLNWKQGSDSSMYVDSPRQDVVETYSRLNKQVESDGIGPRLGRMQNIQATEHKIQRKHRLPGYSGGLRADIADAVIKLDNDLADLKAKIMIRSERERLRSRDYYLRPRYYRDVYYAAGDHDEYDSDHSTGRYRRNVDDNILRELDKLHLFISSIRGLSASPQIKFSHFQNHKCQHGSARETLRRKDNVKYFKVREQKYSTGTSGINTNTLSGVSGEHIEITPNNRVPTFKQMSSFCLYWNTSFNCLHVFEPNKGKYPTIKGRTARVIISLGKILQDISTLRRIHSHKYPWLNTHDVIWRDRYKTPGIHGNSQNFTASTRMSNRHSTNVQVNLFVLTTQANVTSGGNEVLTVFKKTLGGDFTLLLTCTDSRQLTTDRMSKDMLKQIRSGNRNRSPFATAKRKHKLVDKQQISLPSRECKKLLAQASPDSDQAQEQLNLITSAKVDQRSRVHLTVYLKTLCRPSLKIHTKWSRRQVFPGIIHVNHNRLTLYPSLLVLCNCSNPDLHTKDTGKVDFVRQYRPRTTSLRFMPFPNRDHIQYIRRRPRLRLASNNPNELAVRRPLANRIETNGKEKGAVIILQTNQRDLYPRTMHSNERVAKIYAGLRMLLNLRRLASNFRNNGFLNKSVGHETFVTTPQFIDSGLNNNIAFKNQARSKRSSHELSADPETIDEISLKEDLDNLFKKFPVSDSEKILNSKLELAKEAELASIDVGRFIMEKNKDTESTQDVLSSESRFRRHLQASEDNAERALKLDNQKYWYLGAFSRRTIKSVGEREYERRGNSTLRWLGNTSNTSLNDSLGAQNYSNSSIKEGLEAQNYSNTSLKDSWNAHTYSNTSLKDSLNAQNYSNSSHTRDNIGKPIKLPTDTNKVTQNRTTYTLSKLVNLLRTGVDQFSKDILRMWLRFPRRAHSLNISGKLSTPYPTTSAQATSEDRNFPHRHNYVTDTKRHVSQSPVNSSNSNGFNTSQTNLKTDKFPETGFIGELQNGGNVKSERSLPDVPHASPLDSSYQNVANANNVPRKYRLPSRIMLNSSYRNFANFNQRRVQLPASAMMNSTYKNFTNINSAMRAFMENSTDQNITELNKALRTYMTLNTTAGKKSEQLANISGGADQELPSVADYFDNNANVEEAAETQDMSDESTDTRDEKEKAEIPEVEEGIQVDVKGKKVEPTEPFAFIEKDEAKKPTEYQYTWAEWSECSVTCGLGQRFRTNRCGDQPCGGDKASSETEVCSIKEAC